MDPGIVRRELSRRLGEACLRKQKSLRFVRRMHQFAPFIEHAERFQTNLLVTPFGL